MNAGAGALMWAKKMNVSVNLVESGIPSGVGASVHRPLLPFVKRIKCMTFEKNAGTLKDKLEKSMDQHFAY